MSNFGKTLKKVVAETLAEALAKSNLTVREDDYWVKTGQSLSYDIVVYRGVYPLAIVEVREQLQGKEFLLEAQNSLKEAISFTNARYGILTNAESHLLYDKSHPEAGFQNTTFDEVIDLLLEIKGAWDAMPDEVRNAGGAGFAAGQEAV